jgi:hypothetical protein
MADNGTDDLTGVPMLAPDGSVRQVPHELAPTAIKSGGQVVARVQAPTGDLHWVPYSQVHDAISKGGGKMVDSSIIPDAPTQKPDDKGFLSGLWDSTLGGLTNFGKHMSDYYDKTEDPTKMSGGQIASNLSQQLVLGPAKILKDAAVDPQHPIHQLVTGLLIPTLIRAEKQFRSFRTRLQRLRVGISLRLNVRSTRRKVLDLARLFLLLALPL